MLLLQSHVFYFIPWRKQIGKIIWKVEIGLEIKLKWSNSLGMALNSAKRPNNEFQKTLEKSKGQIHKHSTLGRSGRRGLSWVLVQAAQKISC